MRSGKVRVVVPLLVLVCAYLLGPTPDDPILSQTFPEVPEGAHELEAYVTRKESLHQIKEGNEARIVWYDSTNRKTPYAVVYLHGFSASQMEGDPIHRRFAKDFGCNLYLARLADHGIDTTEALLNFTADRFWESSKEALAIASKLGDRVIIMSTSTGSTTALKLAAEFPDKVHALINLSPNIAINNPAAFLLNNPWGLYIARSVMGGKYKTKGEDVPSSHSQFWNSSYRLEAAVELQELIEETMVTSTFEKVHQPSLTLYYYRNEVEQDPEVKVDAILRMHSELGTPDDMKVAVAIPDAGAHVIGSSLTSKDVEGVYREIENFATEKLNLQKR